MCKLTSYLISKFKSWCPSPPVLVSASVYDIELAWTQSERPFGYLNDLLLYRICVNDKMYGWKQVYCGGKTSNVIPNLSPAHAYQFKLQVIVRQVANMAEATLAHYTNENNMYKCLGEHDVEMDCSSFHKQRFVESSWSDATTANTLSMGSSVMCLCLAVKGGYMAQVQSILEERPSLVNVVHASTGQTPLTTAIRRGDLPMVKLVLSMGADMEQRATCERTPLHDALIHQQHHIAMHLMEAGAHLQCRDVNGLSAEHMCVRTVQCVQAVKQHGGDFTLTDNNGWTPLYHAVLLGVGFDVLHLLVKYGCDIHVKDNRGLGLMDAAGMARFNDVSLQRVLSRRHPPSTAAAQHFARITNIITTLNTIKNIT